MFGFSKRNKKEAAKIEAAVNAFTPSFGDANDFVRAYGNSEGVVIARCDGEDVVISAGNVLIINDDQDSVVNQCVVPMVDKSNLSCAIYDPDGVYQKALGDVLKKEGYELNVIDLNDEAHKSRIDLFETANITRNAYWTAFVLAEALKCEDKYETKVAQNLFMAMMQYALSDNKKITVESLSQMFESVRARDEWLLEKLHACSASVDYIEEVDGANSDVLENVFTKIESALFVSALDKIKKPNVFTVSAHKVKSAFFIKRVPEEYRWLVTIFLFNFKITSIVCGKNKVNSLIIDASNDDWYDREVLEMIRQGTDSLTDKCAITVAIKGTVSSNDDEQFVVYMKSGEKSTKDYVYNWLTVRNQLTRDEKDKVSIQFFDVKPIPENVLNSAPITRKELDKIGDCIVIDVSKKVKAFRCERLN